MTTFVFDGSFEGLLASVFEYYERKPGKIQLVCAAHFQPAILGGEIEIISDETKSKRVWEGLKKKLSKDWQARFYKAFLAETAEIFQHLFDFTCYIFDNPDGAQDNYGHRSVIAIAQADRSVNRERHRMKAFIRFQETADGIFYAPIEPDFNVLPLVAGFFRDRYADQKWIIYDLRRKYGLYYDLETVEAIRLDHAPELKSGTAFLTDDLTHDKEHLYGLMWNDYFRSTNIAARKNMALHIRHVPKRYWKHLTEKQEMEKQFFIAIVPPKEIADAVTAIKQDFADRFESSRALRVVPHITLKAPFRIFEGKRKGLLQWFGKLDLPSGMFEIRLNGFGAFDNPKNPVIFVNPEPSENLNALQRLLIAKLSNLLPKEVSPADTHFHPHMTVAYRDLSAEHFEKAWPEYQSKAFSAAFTVGAFHLLEHDGTKWNIVATKNL